MTSHDENLVDVGRHVGSGPLRMFVGAVVVGEVLQFVHSQLATHLPGRLSRVGLSVPEGLLLAQLLGTVAVGAVCVGALRTWLRRLDQSGSFGLERTPLAVAAMLLLVGISAKLGIVAIDWVVLTRDHALPFDYRLYGSILRLLSLPASHCGWIALAMVLIAARPPAGLAYLYLAARAGFALYALMAEPNLRGVPPTTVLLLDYGLTLVWVALARISMEDLEPPVCLESGPAETQVAVSGLGTIRLALWFRIALAFLGLVGLRVLLLRDALEPESVQLAVWVLFAAEVAITLAVLSGISRLSSLSALGAPTDGFGTTAMALIGAIGLSALGLVVVLFARDATDYHTAKSLLSLARWMPRLSIVLGLIGTLSFFSALGGLASWAEDPLGQRRANAAFWLTLGSAALGMFALAYIETSDPGAGAMILLSFAMLYAAGLTVTLVSLMLRDTARALASMELPLASTTDAATSPEPAASW